MTSPRPHEMGSKSCLLLPCCELFPWDDVPGGSGSVSDTRNRSPISTHSPTCSCPLLHFSTEEMLPHWGLRGQLLPIVLTYDFHLVHVSALPRVPSGSGWNTGASWNASEASKGCGRWNVVEPPVYKVGMKIPSCPCAPALSPCLSSSHRVTRVLWDAHIWTIDAMGCTFWWWIGGKKDTHKFSGNEVKKINPLDDNEEVVEFISTIIALDLYCVRLDWKVNNRI